MAPRIRVCLEGPLAPSLAPLRALSAAQAHHLARVLRAAQGDPLVVFDGLGSECDAVVESIVQRKRELEISLRLLDPVRAGVRADRANVVILQALLKSDKVDSVVRACAELGATGFVPVWTDHVVLRGSVREDLDKQRAWQRDWQHLAVGASEQCGRADVMHVQAPQTLLSAAQRARQEGRVGLFADEQGGPTAHQVLSRVDCSAGIAVVVGPEGGLSRDERRALQDLGIIGFSLGPRVLRAETAGPAIMATLSALVGDTRAESLRA
ncbi:MAG: RsmE family RNA methyltransferase [Deltaproteobacteria bacterium]|nr:RsmE family RNA methyltransferase [Deltaproteobacteria bacterium]